MANKKVNWNFSRMRQGYNPVQLQQEDKEGKLRTVNNLLDEESEYYQGKFNFPEEELNYYKQVFKFFDKTGAEQLSMSDLGLAMRAAGCIVTESEIKILSKKVDQYSTGYCRILLYR